MRMWKVMFVNGSVGVFAGSAKNGVGRKHTCPFILAWVVPSSPTSNGARKSSACDHWRF